MVTLVVMRYELLSIAGAAGLGAWFLRTEPPRAAMRVWIALACGTVAISALAHGRLLAEYIPHPPDNPKRLIARHLETAAVRNAMSDYWIAYAVTFLTNERVIVSSTDFARIQEYQRLVDEHRDEAIHVSRRWRVGGRSVVPGVFLCRP